MLAHRTKAPFILSHSHFLGVYSISLLKVQKDPASTKFNM